MSETVMFKDVPATGGKEEGIEIGTGTGVASEVYPQNQSLTNSPGNVPPEQYSQSTLSAYVMASPRLSNKFAVSLALMPLPGVDATIKVFDRTFFTASVTDITDPGTQLILQRRLLFNDPFGISLGLSYQRTNHFISSANPECLFCFPDRSYFTNSVGIRAVVMVKPLSYFGDNQRAIYANGGLNYDLTLKAHFIRMGISLAIL